MSNIYFMCENCGIETNGITLVNGMKFCAKCYHQIFGKDNQQTEITQLKQQLAETEQKFLEFQEDSIRNERTLIIELAEKDKEIEKLKQQYTILENENGKLTTELIMDKYKKAQKEVSFGKQLALQELEKVKILLQNAVNYDGYTFVEIYDAVNNQIKELKGEKDAED